MSRQFLLLALCAMMLGDAGCAGPGKNQSPARVVVVDLDRVARELGREQAMSAELLDMRNALTSHLKAEELKLTENLEEKEKASVRRYREVRSTFGEVPADYERREFFAEKQTAQKKFDELQRQALAQITQRRDILIEGFRDDIRPTAERIAKSKGAQLVATKNDSVVFAYDDSIDITDEVIAEMRANSKGRSAPSPTPVPELNLNLNLKTPESNASSEDLNLTTLP